MRGTLRAVATTGLLLVLGTAGLAGQTRLVLGVGGGPIFPNKSSFSDNTYKVKSVGYHFQFMLGVAPGNGKLSFRVDGQYGSVKYEPLTTGTVAKDKIFAVNADLVFHPTTSGGVRPYLLAGPTYGHFSFRSGLTGTASADETTNNVGFNGGAGLNFGNSEKIWFFLESRYIYTKDHKYIPVTLGVRINTGQAYTKKS
ncbi:MAG TPA: outer membrane beta-barrel protein [Gemmatimonadales bacterium]|nr:outer membrane beta-barrel protein [Gemmatimonadales bacterium]